MEETVTIVNQGGQAGFELAGINDPIAFANRLAQSSSTTLAVSIFNQEMEKSDIKKENYSVVFKALINQLTYLAPTHDLVYGGKVNFAQLKLYIMDKLRELRRS